MFLQPIVTGGGLQMSDEINESHDHDGENVRCGEGRNKQSKRREQTGFQVNNHNSGKDIDVERGRPNGTHSISDLVRRRAGHLPQRRVHHGLLARVQHEQKGCPHDYGADRKQQKDSRDFSQHVFQARHRLRKNGVNRAVFDVLWKQPRSGNDCQKRGKKRDRAERNILQDLEFLLKRKLRHEDRAADQKKREDQQNVKNFQACQLSDCVDRNRINARERKGPIPLRGR